MWLGITTVLSLLTGWFGLSQTYPNRDDVTATKLRGQSGVMGLWVAMSRVLSLDGCPSGLRVGMNRLFGPFCRSFFVPWGEVGVERSSFLFMPMVKVTFARSATGALWLYPRTWDRLQEQLPNISPSLRLEPPITNADLLRGSFLQWAFTTTLAASFFYFASRQMPANAPSIPLAVCIGFPAVTFGLNQVFAYFLIRRRSS